MQSRRRPQSETNISTGDDQKVDRHCPSENGGRKTILFVDDDLSVLAAHRLIFEAFGYLVLTADNGPEALDLFRANTVHAIVLDYAMSPMNGEEIARVVRWEDGETPIVLSSGYPFLPASVLEVIDVSVDKGSGPEALVEVLQRLLSTRCRR